MRIISRFSTTLVITAVAACALPIMSAKSRAADCPAGKTAVDAMKPGPMTPSKVTDTVISSIDLAPIGSGFEGRKMRLRKLVVQPGGVVPWHSKAANQWLTNRKRHEWKNVQNTEVEVKRRSSDEILAGIYERLAKLKEQGYLTTIDVPALPAPQDDSDIED